MKRKKRPITNVFRKNLYNSLERISKEEQYVNKTYFHNQLKINTYPYVIDKKSRPVILTILSSDGMFKTICRKEDLSQLPKSILLDLYDWTIPLICQIKKWEMQHDVSIISTLLNFKEADEILNLIFQLEKIKSISELKLHVGAYKEVLSRFKQGLGG